MIKIERTHDCKSYWKNDGLYDKYRVINVKIKIFGVTIWSNTESYDSDLISVNDSNGMGFKVDKK
jgi:hypothetical protein